MTDTGPPVPPEHPHYTLLSNLRKEVDEHLTPETFASQEDIDFASLMHTSAQRALGALEASKKEEAQVPEMLIELSRHVLLAATHLDGFVLGYLFALGRTDR